MRLLREVVADVPRVEVTSFSGLLVEFAKSQGVKVVLRVVRTVIEFEVEAVQAHMNRELGGLETVYLAVDERYRLISSTLVREIASYGRSLKGLVPEAIEEEVARRFFA